MKSGSLKRLAEELTVRLGYKVWRTTGVRKDRQQLLYGDLVDKLSQYQFFKKQGLSAFDFTTDAAEAQKWLNSGICIIGRQTLTGSCGAGIVVYEPDDPVKVGGCKVYCKYKPKKREFRVHVFKNTVVAIVEKRKKKDWKGESNPKIRNLDNGFVFCQEVELTAALKERINLLALAASKVCSSDFRGVDLGYNEKNDDLFVIEVNSAPGIEGSNVKAYCDAIVKVVK
jgi:hypothetical protein